MVLCFSVCLIVSAIPVFAAKLDPISGVISLEPETLGLRRNSLTENTIYGFQSAPASFELSDDTYRFTWQSMTAYTGFYSTVTESGKELSFIFNFGDGVGDVLVAWDSLLAKPLFKATFADDTSQLIDFTWTGDFDMFVDGSRVYHRDLTDDPIPSVYNWEGSVSRYIEIRITSLEDSVNVVDIEDASIINQYIGITTNGLTVNDESVIIEDISVSVKNIEQDLGDIKDSVGNIESGLGDLNDTADSINTTVTNISTGVVDIKDQITDMTDQLENSDSPIWQAGAEAITGAVEGLFVPDETDLQEMYLDGVDFLKRKTGGLVVATDLDSELDNLLVEGLAAGDSSGFEFSGITVPLGGDIGDVVLAEPQEVSLPIELQQIFHPIATTISVVIFGLGTFHIVTEMLHSLLSGMSYAQFLFRNRGGS